MIFISNIVPAESGSAVLMTQKGEKRKITPVFLQDVLPLLAKKMIVTTMMMRMIMIMRLMMSLVKRPL